MLQIISRHKLIFVLFITITMRLGILFAFPSVFAFDQTNTIHGSDAYDRYAQNILATGVYGLEAGVADASIPPIYSYALATIYGIFGRGYIQVGIFHILLDCLSIFLLYETVKRVFRWFETNTERIEWIATVTGLCYAIYPYLIFQNLTLIDTPLFITLLHLFIFMMVLLRDQETLNRKTWLIAILGGIVLGITTLARPVTPPLAILIALWFLFRIGLWQTILRLLPVALLSVACLVPWMVRNYGIFDQIVLMTTTSGANFWQGNNPYTIPVFQAGYDVQWTAPEGVASTNIDPDADAQRMALGVDFWRENSDLLPELFWTKFLIHWSIDIAPRYNLQEGQQFEIDEEGALQIIQSDESIVGVNDANTAYNEPLFDVVGRWVHRIYYGGLFIFAIIGIFHSVRYWRDISLFWFIQISMTLIYVVFHPSTRYRVPSDPMLFVFSAYTLILILYFFQNRNRQPL